MSRTSRLDTPGILHHVMIRGIERRDVFTDDEDRENLIERLSDLLPVTGTLLEREATSEYLSLNYAQMVKEVQKILTRSETEVLS